MNDNKGTQRPYLHEFVDGLKQQNDLLGKQSEHLFSLTNQFRDIRQPQAKSEDHISKDPNGIIDILNSELSRMCKYNDMLRQTCEGLQSIVGN